MPGLRFSKLGEKFIAALEMSGATLLVLSAPDVRPLTVSVTADGTTYRLEVYLWTITPGGAGRNQPGEFRIQRTGMDAFVLKAGVRTIMGGWHPETNTFAFWDVRRHLSTAQSPSTQISIETLQRAGSEGMATELRQLANDVEEVAIAVQPDFLLWYVQEYERIYDSATEVQDASTIVDASPEEERNFIDTGATPPEQSRRHQLVEVLQHFRDARFRPKVLRAYEYRCCLTGMALRLVEAAHIVPVADPRSTDEPRNGVALSPILHRAYDAGLLGLFPGGRTGVNPRLMEDLRRQGLDAGHEAFQAMIPARMRMPIHADCIPPDDYFTKGLQARGWRLGEISAVLAVG